MAPRGPTRVQPPAAAPGIVNRAPTSAASYGMLPLLRRSEVVAVAGENGIG